MVLIRVHERLNSYLHDSHGIIAKNIHDLDRNLSRTGFTLMGDALEFKRAVLFGSEVPPLVLEDILPGPLLFPLTKSHLLVLLTFGSTLYTRIPNNSFSPTHLAVVGAQRCGGGRTRRGCGESESVCG
jgi:hypothetical protein